MSMREKILMQKIKKREKIKKNFVANKKQAIQQVQSPPPAPAVGKLNVNS